MGGSNSEAVTGVHAPPTFVDELYALFLPEQ
jgi:hypothetical protein